jgi:nucleoside-diphosphate-sugar epimerase
VDDCAEAYLALVEHPNRASVTGQCFNISAHRYETADTVVQALADEYKLAGGAKFTFTAEDAQAVPMGFTFQAVFGYSQWVDSGKIRALTGWTDRRLLFTQNLDVYRRAYEAAAKSGHEDIARVKARSKAWNGTI